MRFRRRDFWWPWGCFVTGWFLSFSVPDTFLSLVRMAVLFAAGLAVSWLARHRFRVERRTRPTGLTRLRITDQGVTTMDDETIGDLADRIPAEEWVDLPEYGIRVWKWGDTFSIVPAPDGGDRDAD